MLRSVLRSQRTEDCSMEVKAAFYGELQGVVDKTVNRKTLIVIGDLNARVERNKQTWGSVLGSHGEAIKNGSGDRLLQFCSVNEMLVTNTWFQHNNIHKYTWECPGRQLKSLIDYILVRKDIQSLILDP